jgi:sterol desaturase/sphingolipid hydroxylase (fatty acid hydroxylase superfamily)
MDYTSLIIALGIALYGASEYRRREAVHAKNLSEIRRGMRPSFEPRRVGLWQVFSAVSVGVLLVACIVGLLVLEFRTGVKACPYLPLILFFSLLLVLVAFVVLRTLVSYLWWRDRR